MKCIGSVEIHVVASFPMRIPYCCFYPVSLAATISSQFPFACEKTRGPPAQQGRCQTSSCAGDVRFRYHRAICKNYAAGSRALCPAVTFVAKSTRWWWLCSRKLLEHEIKPGMLQNNPRPQKNPTRRRGDDIAADSAGRLSCCSHSQTQTRCVTHEGGGHLRRGASRPLCEREDPPAGRCCCCCCCCWQ